MNRTVLRIVPNVIIRNVSRQILIAKKNSPHIFFAAGVVGAVTSTVLACRATLKLSVTLDDIKEDVEDFKKISAADEYMSEDYHKDRIYVYGGAGLKLAKLYGPSVLVGTASIALLTGSHVQLTRRNSALMAAYAAIQKAYDDYRERVREELGDKKELDIYHAATDVVAVDSEGNKLAGKVVDPSKYSAYAKFFDEFSPNWQRDPELNRIFVQCQQNYANDLLKARGHLFLNEVYDMLGVDRSRAGAVVGWVIGPEGDNYVDFGMFQAFNSPFVNGFEQSILLDFNVDGVIYDKI